MSDWNDGAKRGEDHASSEGKVILIIPKSKTIEQRVTVKRHKTRAKMGQPAKAFIEIREFWYKNGALEEPIHTRKGTMVHREHIPKLCLALLRDMKRDEVDMEIIGQIRTQLARLDGKMG